jgi:hypothetical protein
VSQLETLQNWLKREDGGNRFLEASEELIWQDDDIAEYACLAPSAETDVFTRGIRLGIVKVFPYLFRSRKGKDILDPSSGLRTIDDERINTASNVISLVLSSTLPVAAIFVLNSRDSTTERLGFTVLFTAVFALALGLCSSAKRAEIFAATATYVHTSYYRERVTYIDNRFAAVEVVFIGTALAAENNPPAPPPLAPS